METDDSSGMNQLRQCMNSGETSENSNPRVVQLIGPLTNMTMMLKSVNNKEKTKALENDCQTPDGSRSYYHNRTLSTGRSACPTRQPRWRRHTQSINSRSAIKHQSKTLFLVTSVSLLLPLLLLLLSIVPFAQAGFWTFYFPNFLKPSGYKEIGDMIYNVEMEINATKDAFADSQYFWGLMQQLDKIGDDETSFYPEESVCAEVFPMFRDLAIEYAYIDYEHFIQPMLEYHEHLNSQRALWYPEGKKGKTILPREWEQKLYEKDLSLKIIYHTKLAQTAEFKQKREQMVSIWRSVKRGLDSSLPCIYLRYAVRHVADDINQQALDINLERMNEAMEMLKSAYKRIENYSESDAKAKSEIHAVLERENRYEIRS